MAVVSSRPHFKLTRMWPAEGPSVIVSVVDLGCIECAAQLVRSLHAYPGVKRARLDYTTGRLRVWGPLSQREIIRYVKEMGYEPVAEDGAHGTSKRQSFWSPKTRLWLTIVGLLFLLAGVLAQFYALTWPSSWVLPAAFQALTPPTLCFYIAILAGLLFPFRTAMYSVFRGALETNFIVCLVSLGAGIVGAWLDSALIVTAYSLFGFIEAKRLKRARLIGLDSSRPDVAEHQAVTGLSSALSQQVDEVGQGLTVGHPLVKLYTTTLMVLAVLIAGVPPLIFGTAINPWLYLALKLLLISRPGALVAGLPSAITAAVNHASKMGIALKDSTTLMQIARVNAVAFDQSGTLTQGNMMLSDIVSIGDITQERVLQTAASIDWGSDHPMGAAIAEAATSLDVPSETARFVNVTAGLGAQATVNGRRVFVGHVPFMRLQGIDVSVLSELISEYEASGKSCIVVAEEDQPIGMVALSDTVREGSARAIRRLQRIRGIRRVALLSEESQRLAADMAEELHIKEVFADLSPAAKVGTIEQWKQASETVAVVGDGNNPSLVMAADIGIVMTDGDRVVDEKVGTSQAGGTDVRADVIIRPREPSHVPFLIALARRTARVIRRNIALAILLKLGTLYFIFSGKLTLGLVGVIEMGSSLYVTWSGTRLLRKVRIKSR